MLCVFLREYQLLCYDYHVIDMNQGMITADGDFCVWRDCDGGFSGCDIVWEIGC